MEYIYLHDRVWNNKRIDNREEPVQIGIIVTDVSKESDGYFFTIKETNERRVCQYAWAFAENTPSNVERVRDYLIAKGVSIQAKVKLDKAFRNVITLERTKEEIRTIKLTELANGVSL